DALREYAGIDLAYWNDFRNVEYHVRKTGQNVPNPLDTTAAATLEPDNYIRTGSPLDPRLPESINIRFTLFLQAPSVGSPDFVQTFSQRIPVPTGFRRPNEIQ